MECNYKCRPFPMRRKNLYNVLWCVYILFFYIVCSIFSCSQGGCHQVPQNRWRYLHRVPMLLFFYSFRLFSSAGDIVSRAYAIPSRPASVPPSSVSLSSTFSKNHYSSYSFYLILMKLGTHILGFCEFSKFAILANLTAES